MFKHQSEHLASLFRAAFWTVSWSRCLRPNVSNVFAMFSSLPEYKTLIGKGFSFSLKIVFEPPVVLLLTRSCCTSRSAIRSCDWAVAIQISPLSKINFIFIGLLHRQLNQKVNRTTKVVSLQYLFGFTMLSNNSSTLHRTTEQQLHIFQFYIRA